MTRDKSVSLIQKPSQELIISRILLGEDLPAKGFKGYFVARFSQPFNLGGISRKGILSNEKQAEGKELSGWVEFPEGTFTVEVRMGVSFISIEQARKYVSHAPGS